VAELRLRRAPGSMRVGEGRGGSGAGKERSSGAPYIGGEGKGKGRPRRWAAAHRRPPLRPGGGLGAWAFPGGEEAGTASE
jgi:hypothetical protein